MATSDVKTVYQGIINDVCKAVKEALIEEGYDDHTLQELRTLWLGRLENSRALEPLSVSTVDQATNREFRHSTPSDPNRSIPINTKPATGIRPNQLHQASNVAVSNFNTVYPISTSVFTATNPGATQVFRAAVPNRPPTSMKTSNQLDGANDEASSITKKKKKSKMITISFQLDGTGPPVDDDDDEEEDSDVEPNDVGDDLDDDDDDDEGNIHGKEDSNPLCSEDDDTDSDEPNELFEADNVVVCQYDKVSRTKNKWRFILKSGVMNIEGHDYVFSKATGEADW